MGTLFVTGASGFIGRRLLARIPPGRYQKIIALSRHAQEPLPGVMWVRGDVKDPATWRQHLSAGIDIAHLAAATGGASASEHRAVNAEATEALVKAAERAKAGGLLFVSSIAARFTPDARYPYATAKREAEVLVRAARIPWSIVRPTIVLGQGSAILDKLRALAGGPVVSVIGKGTAKVQPIDVEDLAAALAVLLERRMFDSATREIGGPEVLTMEALLLRVRSALGKPAARVVRVPYGPMRGGLIVLESLLGGRSPATAGQLTSFVEDSVAAPDPFWESLRPGLLTVDRMIAAGHPRD
jgi:uncharacterized protein YbjT (DUF2867 family)